MYMCVRVCVRVCVCMYLCFPWLICGSWLLTPRAPPPISALSEHLTSAFQLDLVLSRLSAWVTAACAPALVMPGGPRGQRVLRAIQTCAVPHPVLCSSSLAQRNVCIRQPGLV